jgi:hypothetical protein
MWQHRHISKKTLPEVADIHLNSVALCLRVLVHPEFDGEVIGDAFRGEWTEPALGGP